MVHQDNIPLLMILSSHHLPSLQYIDIVSRDCILTIILDTYHSREKKAMVLSQIFVGFVDGEFFKRNGFSSNALLVLREVSINKRNIIVMEVKINRRAFYYFKEVFDENRK